MAEVASAYVTLMPSFQGGARAIASELNGPLDQAGREGGRRLGQGVERGGRSVFASAGKTMASAFAGAFAAIGITQIIGSAASAVIDFTKDSISAASDLNESINAVNVAYGDSAEKILKIGQNAARGLGLSRNEFNGISVQFSAFARQIAGDGGDVSRVIKDLAGRGADFASVFNLEVSEALALFQSGLAGETEPLRRYGLDLSAASVQAYALSKGIAKASVDTRKIELAQNAASRATRAYADAVKKYGEESEQASKKRDAMTRAEIALEEATEGSQVQLTAQQQVLARYGLLMEQTAMTQGDFANTSDSLANRQRILAAEVENAKAAIGTELLPVLNDFYGWALNEGVPILQQLARWVKENKTAIHDWAVDSADFLLSLVQVFLAVGSGFAGVVQGIAAGLRMLSEGFYSFVLGVNSDLIDLAEMYDAVFGTNNAQKLKDRRRDLEAYRDTAVAKLHEVEQSASSMKAQFDSGIRAINGLRDSIAKLKDKDVYVKVHKEVLGNGRIRIQSTEMRARGGPVNAGQPYIVGEREPELFIPDRPGVILNQRQMAEAGIGAGGAGVVQNIYPAARQSEYEIGRVAADQLSWAGRL